MACQYIADNPRIVVNGFIKDGISDELDARSTDSESAAEALLI